MVSEVFFKPKDEVMSERRDMNEADLIIILQRRLENSLALDPKIAAQVAQYLITTGVATYSTLFDECSPLEHQKSEGKS